MATADIQKVAVFDSRIVQPAEKYAVNKGALSLTNAPYNAIGASASQQTYNINVPSQNVFVDRGVEWTSTVYQKFQATTPAVANVNSVGQSAAIAPAAGAWTNITAIYTPGIDFALCSFPLHQMCGTITATINDTSVVMNLDTVLREVLRLTDYKKNRLIRTCPTMMDKYALYSSAANAINNVLSGFQNATEPAEVPNGAWFDLVFTDAAGLPLAPNAAALLPGAGFYQTGATFVLTYNGLPCRTPNLTGGAASVQLNILGASSPAIPYVGAPVVDAGAGATYQLYIRWTTTEKLVLSPFIFADAHEWSTGLFGINNIQLVMNLSADGAARCIRTGSSTVVVPGSVQFGTAPGGSSPFANPKINVQFLTPSLDLPLPPKSAVPFAEYPRYISTNVSPNGPVPAGQRQDLNSQTITLPQIPDAVIIYVKPDQLTATAAAAGSPNGYGDFYMPITGISVNFDNFAGLLSSHTTEQLYQMAAHNGLEMDYTSWRGKGVLGAANASVGSQGLTSLVGGYLVLRMGQDICLQSGQAPGLVGNFTLQFRVTVENTTAVALNPILYVIAVNTGFFETLAGSSRIVKGVLSEADIIAAEPLPEMSQDGLARVVGSGFFDKIGSFITKARDTYAATKPAVSAIKNMLPAGKVKDALGAVGYGHAGAGGAGAGMAGAGKKKSLAARLMM